MGDDPPGASNDSWEGKDKVGLWTEYETDIISVSAVLHPRSVLAVGFLSLVERVEDRSWTLLGKSKIKCVVESWKSWWGKDPPGWGKLVL